MLCPRGALVENRKSYLCPVAPVVEIILSPLLQRCATHDSIVRNCALYHLSLFLVLSHLSEWRGTNWNRETSCSFWTAASVLWYASISYRIDHKRGKDRGRSVSSWCRSFEGFPEAIDARMMIVRNHNQTSDTKHDFILAKTFSKIRAKFSKRAKRSRSNTWNP